MTKPIFQNARNSATGSVSEQANLTASIPPEGWRGLLNSEYVKLDPASLISPGTGIVRAPSIQKRNPAKTAERIAAGEGTTLGRPAFFLRTKLLPPRAAPELLTRERLVEKLRNNLSTPVTLVTANAGSGKTTLVADFVRNLERKSIWYQLDPTDTDPAVFVGYLVQGLKSVSANFGEIIGSFLDQSAAEIARQPERAVDILLNEIIEGIDEPVILVLDDYHHLGEKTAVHAVVDRLLQYLPDVLHVVIISRDMPPLSLARLRSQSSLCVIDRSDLLFTDGEIQELFRKVFDIAISAEQLTTYRERTHGWITALQLVRQVAQRQALARGGREIAPTELDDIFRQSEKDIFDYFAEEVFADETEDVQKLLMKLSLLERIDTEICGALFPELDSGNVLPKLVRRNVFITVASDAKGEEYRLHPLFQSFLRRKLRVEIGRGAVAEENARLAAYFIRRGALDVSMAHLIAAEKLADAAALIAEKGSEWIQSGALNSLILFTSSLPQAEIEKHPRAIVYQAEAERILGNYDTAQKQLKRAVALLRQTGDYKGEAEALHSLATIERRRGDNARAFEFLDQASRLVEQNSRLWIKCGNTRGLCLMATGDLNAAEREFRIALNAAEEQGDEHYVRLIAHNLGLPAGIRGDFGEAIRWSKRMLRSEGAVTPIPQEATAHLNLARFHLYLGHLDECEKQLDEALRQSQLFNLTGLLGEVFEAYGSLFRERGDAARSAEYLERAARAYSDAGITLAQTELFEEQSTLALQMNDIAGAKRIINRLIESRAGGEDELKKHTALLALAKISLAERDFTSVVKILKEPAEYFKDHYLYFYEAQACLAISIAELNLDNNKGMLLALKRALDLAARYDYDYWLKREISRSPELLRDADAAELLPGDVRELASNVVNEQVARAESQALAVANPLRDLTIKLLGPVEILRDVRRTIGAEAWTTKRARDIFCFIASRPHRRASKDVIIDTFWPDSEFEAVEKNFHPTVSHIRKALNNNQPLKLNFLLYREGDYQLNSEYSYRVDIEEFDRLIEQGDNAKRSADQHEFVLLYEKALELYRGEFMQGSYDEWVEEQRSYYREEYLRILETLALMSMRSGEWARAMHLSQRAVREDPFREDVHCTIMKAHAASGNRSAVKEQFETLKKLLRGELGVEPAAETLRIYRELMK